MSGRICAARKASGKFHLGGIGFRVEKIGADRVVEKVGVLRNGADALMQRIEPRLADIDPVDGDRAILHVIEPGNEVSDRGLSRPRRAHEREKLSRLGNKGDVRQRRLLRRLFGHGNRF